MIGVTLTMAFRAIFRSGMRSILTVLGVVIGVSAVIAMVTLGQGASERVTSDIEKMGNNMLTVMPGADRRGGATSVAKAFRLSDVKAIERQVPGVRAVAPSASKTSLLVVGSHNHSARVDGSWNSYFEVRGLTVGEGRIFTDGEQDGAALVCVLGAKVASELFPSQKAIGTTVRIGSLPMKVVGVLQSKGSSVFGVDPDDFVVVPLATFQRRVAGSTDVSAIYVSSKNDKVAPRVRAAVEGLMRERRHLGQKDPADFNVLDMKEIAQTMASVTGALTALLGAIAAVSLLVGGIGIMNIMLVSVTERTREIGIRLSIGALARDVLVQFLVEAVALSLFGGLIGIGLGLLGSWGACRGAGLPFHPSVQVVILGFGFSAAIGVIFGYFPARKAARLDPIEALRHE